MDDTDRNILAVIFDPLAPGMPIDPIDLVIAALRLLQLASGLAERPGDRLTTGITAAHDALAASPLFSEVTS